MLWPQLLDFSDTGLFLLRLTVAVIFLYHAYPKLKNSKGMAAMMGSPSMPWFPAVLGAMEALGALSVLFGVYFQLGALILVVVMVGATAMKIGKWKMPFSAMDKTGWEFDLLLLASALLFLLVGGGSVLMLG